MATKTMSASVDEEILERTDRAAEEERRPRSAVVSAALALYTSLDAGVRGVIEEMVRRGEVQELVEQIERVTLDVRWNLLALEVDPGVRKRLSALSDEEADLLVGEAIAEVRSERRR